MKKLLFALLGLFLFNTCFADSIYRGEIIDILNTHTIRSGLTQAFQQTLNTKNENCGWIYKKSQDQNEYKLFTYEGNNNSCPINLNKLNKLRNDNPGIIVVAHFHTHPKIENAKERNTIKPSKSDIDLTKTHQLGVDNYYQTIEIIVSEPPADNVASLEFARNYAGNNMTLDQIVTNISVDNIKINYFLMNTQPWKSLQGPAFYSKSTIVLEDIKN